MGLVPDTLFGVLVSSIGFPGLILLCLTLLSFGLIIGGLIPWLAWRKAIINVELSRWRRKQDEVPAKPAEVPGLRSV